LPIIAEVVVLVKTRDTYSPCHEEQGAPHRCAAEMKLGSLLDTHPFTCGNRVQVQELPASRSNAVEDSAAEVREVDSTGQLFVVM
jgi:hypothetical protein